MIIIGSEIFSDYIGNIAKYFKKKITIWDPFSDWNHGVNQKSVFYSISKTAQENIVINLVSDYQIYNFCKTFDYKDDSEFAYSQWQAYLPSLLNSFSDKIINKPKINMVAGVSSSGQVNRVFFHQNSIPTPNEIIISNCNSLHVNDEIILFSDQSGILQHGTPSLKKTIYPITIFTEESSPHPYYCYFDSFFDSFGQIIVQKKILSFLKKISQISQMNWCTMYISKKQDHYLLWNIIPEIPISILKKVITDKK